MTQMLVIESKRLERDDNGYLYYNSKLFTGKAIWYSSEGKIVTEASYTDGVQDGWMRGWYKNGQLRSETLYDKGSVVGTYKEWHENGLLKLEAKVGGEKKEWDESGNILKED